VRRALLQASALLLIAATLIQAAPARAGGFTLTSFGGRRGGMLANLGRPDEPTALVHNPAGLADQRGTQLYVYVSPAFLSLQMELQALDPQRFPSVDWAVGPDGYYSQPIKPERYFGVLPFLGATTNLGFLGPRGRDITVGLSIHAPNFYGAYFPEDAPSAFNFIGGMFLVAGATAGAGWRINRYLAVGASVAYHYMTITMGQKLSTVDLLTPAGQTPGGVATLAQLALGDLRLDYEGVDHGAGWGLGLLITPLPWLNIGLGYTGATAARFSGAVSFRSLGGRVEGEQELRELAGSLGYKLPRELEIEMAIPPALMAGVNLALGTRVELGLDARFWLYNLYDRQTIRPIFNPDEPGSEPITEATLSRDKHYELSYQLTAGVLVRPFARLPGLELMLGTGYDRSPIPDETLTIDNPSLSQVKFTTGVRWQIDPRWRVSATYMLVVYIPRDITTSQTRPPTNIRGAGTSHSPALAVTCRL
jgi:long-subunit fatty acid transport protein